ncbi:MAG: GNAT family N-acetyltransferase [Candidatus Spechtbacterales bacterium]
MKIEVRRIDLGTELSRLVEIEARIFSESDRLREVDFEGTECYWFLAGGVIAGCTALRRECVISPSDGLVQCAGGIYIISTAILPEFQGGGLGKKLKAWQIAYAKSEGFVRMATVCRESNARMIGLNKKFGFRALYVIPNCYHDPEESGIVMELEL